MSIHEIALYALILIWLIYFYSYHTSLSELLLGLAKEVDRLRNEVERLKKKGD